MRKLIYSMGVSLDGFIAGPRGEINWSAPDHFSELTSRREDAAGAFEMLRRQSPPAGAC